MTGPIAVTEQEWQSVKNQEHQHRDVAQAIRALIEEGGKVKIPCPEGMAHKKRESARQMAKRMRIETKYADGWLYLARVEER